MTSISPKTVRIIRDAIIAYCEYRDGRYYATEDACRKVQEILDQHQILGHVAVGDDGRFMITTASTAEHP